MILFQSDFIIIAPNFRFRFGASALKCRLCSVYLHQDCKIQFAMACIPKSQGTPSLKNGKQSYITDYVPADSPMLPPLIVHCVNEVGSTTRKLNKTFFRITIYFLIRLKHVVFQKKGSIVFLVQTKKLRHLKNEYCVENLFQLYRMLTFMLFVAASRTFSVVYENPSFQLISGRTSQTQFKLLMKKRLFMNCLLQSTSCHRPIEIH